MRRTDWTSVRRIFLEGIRAGNATFDTRAPDWEAWDRSHHQRPRIVAETDDAVVGFAALSPASARPAYEGVAEVSVYVAANHWGKGIGRGLLTALVDAADAARIWTLEAVMLAENDASIALHQKCGFREVGRRERIGKLAGRWRDTVLYERRSPMIE